MNSKCNVYFNLLMLFLLICLSFVLAVSQNTLYLHYVLFGGMVICMTWSFNLGLLQGLSIAMIVVFAFGSWLMYSILVTDAITGLRADYLIWMLLIPIGTFITGIISREYSALQKRIVELSIFEKGYWIDLVTGFLNGRGFLQRLEEEVSEAKRYKRSLSLIYMKIANTYEIVSLYGEEETKKILNEIANIISQETRTADTKGFLEGHIFVIQLAETNIDGAETVRKKLSNKLSKIVLTIDGVKKVIIVKSSFGMAEYSTEKHVSSLDLLEQAKEDSNYDMG